MFNLHYRWILVAAGGLLGCVAIGSLFALPVLLRAISDDAGWSITGISTAMTIGFVAMALASMVWGSLSDRIGARPVVLIGAVGLAAALALASRAGSLLEFQLLFGVLGGGSATAIFVPIMATVAGWFDKHRGLAISLVSAGMGMAPMTVSPFAAWLVSNYDWRTSLLAIAAMAAILMIPTAFLIRRPPAQGHATAAPGQVAAQEMTVRQALRSPQFIALMMANFFCCATHSGPIFHTVGYAVACGIPLIAAVTIYSVEGLAGLGGRVAFGLMGDRFGAKRVLVIGLLVQAFVALTYVFVRELAAFYSVAALMGFVYAGVMPLYAVLVRENFPLGMMGTIIGGTSMAGSLGMAAGPLAGGLLYDSYGSYSWLYIGSWGIGIAAFLVAMTFKPFPRPATAGLAAAT